jgi:predicted DCC family thiol-disulfide oxidoreductase YuxK
MKIPNPPAEPLLVFDADCGFCRTWVARWRRLLGDRVACEPFQTAAARFPSIPRSRFRHALHLILPDGTVYQGAEAVFRSLAMAPQPSHYGKLLQLYERLPGARPVSEWGYRWVANHRPQLSRANHFLFGPPPALVRRPGGDGAPAAGAAGDIGAVDLAPVPPHELDAARRRRQGLAMAAGVVGATLLVGGLAARRRRRRRRG